MITVVDYVLYYAWAFFIYAVLNKAFTNASFKETFSCKFNIFCIGVGSLLVYSFAYWNEGMVFL